MAFICRSLWLSALISHVMLAGAWWWAMPTGFSIRNVNFWANQVLPWGVIILGIACRALLKSRPALSATLGVCFPVAWFSSGIAARFVFPQSIFVVWLGPLVVGIVMIVCWTVLTTPENRRGRSIYIAVALSTVLGVWLPYTQRSEEADTRPLNIALKTLPVDATPDTRTIALTSQISLLPDTGEITIHNGARRFYLQPALQFISRSADRGWTLYAQRVDRVGPPRSITGIHREENAAELRYSQDFETNMRVEAEGDNTLTIESSSHLPEPIYSHLNTFTDLSIMGHRKLSVEFSACPGQRIDFTYSDYPRGKPARFAYFHRDGSFHVVEASSAEKGPFHDLAVGRLARGEPLTMTFFDDGIPLYSVCLDDWAAQAGVQESPTAGYGVPVNAIEFSLQDTNENSPASVFITLAGTSVGRGFQSVGHSAGTYRNRMKVEVLRR